MSHGTSFGAMFRPMCGELDRATIFYVDACFPLCTVVGQSDLTLFPMVGNKVARGSDQW